MLKLEAERLLILLDARETYSALSMEKRLVRRLLIAANHGSRDGSGVVIALNLSHETLARLAGTTRQRSNAYLNAWRRAGLVEHHYGRVVIRDPAKLEAVARA